MEFGECACVAILIPLQRECVPVWAQPVRLAHSGPCPRPHSAKTSPSQATAKYLGESRNGEGRQSHLPARSHHRTSLAWFNLRERRLSTCSSHYQWEPYRGTAVGCCHSRRRLDPFRHVCACSHFKST